MDRKYQFGLGAIALIVFCCTAIIAIMFIALWQDRTIVAWCILGLVILVVLVLLINTLNEMSLRRKRYHHQSETPLDRNGYPTLLHKSQQPYQPYSSQDHYSGAQPHDREKEYAAYHRAE